MKTTSTAASPFLLPTSIRCALACICSLFCSALAGAGVGLSGTYTIGGASPDYPDFASALSDLAVQGVSGPTVFSVRNGTYNEQLTIAPVAGASPVNTITFQSESGDSTGVVLTYTSTSFAEPWTLRLYDADHIVFRHMTIEANGTNFAQAVQITENAQYNSFYHNVLKGVVTTTSSQTMIVVFCAVNDNQNATFVHNRIVGGSAGLFFSGNYIIIENLTAAKSVVYSSDIRVDSNTFVNQYYRGIYLEHVERTKVRANVVTTNASYPGFIAIELNDLIDSTKVIGNKIFDLNANASGIVLQGVNAGPNAEALVANNFIEITGDTPNHGILCQNSNKVGILFNTVRVLGANSNGALHLESNDTIAARNNILSNTGGGFAFRKLGVCTCTSDYNNLHSTGPNIGLWDGAPVPNLADWQTATAGQDLHSVAVNPQFASSGSYHPRAIELNGAATPEAAVPLDLDGAARDAQFPDIGAKEFTPDSVDAAVTSIVSPTRPVSAGQTLVQVQLKNNGLHTLTSAQINLKVNDDAPMTTAWTGSLASGDTDTVDLDLVDLVSGEFYDLVAWVSMPNGITDPNADNDTAKLLNLLPALNGVYTIGGSMPDFPTFTGAVSALMQAGVDGPVTFHVRNGTYTEKIDIGSVPGAAGDKPIVFQSESGDSTLVTLAFLSTNFEAPWTLRLNGTRWVTFRKMTIEATAISLAQAVRLTGNAQFNTFSNNILRSTSAPSLSTDRVVVYALDGDNRNNLFRKNRIVNGSTGLWFEGAIAGEYTPGLVADSNQFVNQYHQAAYISAVSAPKIRANTVSSTSTYGFFLGIRVLIASGQTEVTANRIFSVSANAEGMRLESLYAPMGSPTLVANNFVQIAGTEIRTGLFVGYNENIQILNNTVRMSNTHSDSRVLELTTNAQIEIRNNILANTGGGLAVFSNGNTDYASDYNDLFSTGARLGLWDNAPAATLAAWRTLSDDDQNAVSADPQFDGTIAYRPHAVELNGAATPEPNVPTDMDGTTRHSQYPDIGAAEFTPDSADAAVLTLLNLTMPVPAGQTPIVARLKNNGLNTLTSADLYLKVNADAPILINWTGSLASGDTVTVALDTITLSTGVMYNLIAWSALPNGLADQFPGNDTAKVLGLWPALNGIYTIGGTAPNYPTFSTAVTALLQAGVSGPVTFNVRPGPYIEQLLIGPIIGADSTRPVVFQSESGDSTSTTLRFTASSPLNYTVRLNGAKWVTFRKMTLESMHATFGRIVVLENGAQNVTLSNNVLLGAAGASTSIGRALVFASGRNDNILVTNNRILNGSFGVNYTAPFANNATGTHIANNTLIGQSGGAIELFYNANPVVENNTITKPLYSSSFTGIQVNLANSSPRITGNRISTTSDGYGISFQNSSGTEAAPAIVANNYVQLGSSVGSFDFGIQVANCQHARVLYNTVKINGSNSVNAALNLVNNQNSQALNNILYNAGGGYALSFSTTPNAGDQLTDYNNLFTTGATLVSAGSNYPTLLAWKNAGLGFDEHSLDKNPLFYGPNDYRVAQTDLNGAATPSALVSTDIEGNARNAQHPDIGADEFAPESADAGIASLVAPTRPFPAGTQLVQAVLKNYGSATLVSAAIGWSINGAPQPTVPWNGTLAPGATHTVPLDSIPFAIGSLISLKAWAGNPNSMPDVVPANDTATAANLHPALNGLYTIGGTSPDFASFGTATTALANGGVLGAVTFDVRDGTYSEQISLPAILGSSAANTITFQSESDDSTAVTLQFSSTSAGQNYVVQMAGGDWLRFRKMTLKALNTTNSRVVTFQGQSDNNTFENNRFLGVTTTATSDARAIVYAPSGVVDHGTVFRNNYFQDGSDGIFLFGASGDYENGTVVERNRFVNQFRRAINLIYQNAPAVDGNTVSSSTAYNFFNGIVLFFCNGSLGVVNNKLTLDKATLGIAIDNCTGTAANRGLVANNFVQIGGTLQAEGIWFNTSTYQNAYFNSVHINSSNTSSRAFALNAGTNLRLFNNIAHNSGGGYALQRNLTTNIAASDHNDWHTTGADLVFNSNFSTTFANLADWQTATGFDANSISTDPLFVSATDLHTSNVLLNGNALPFPEVPTDMDGQVRNSTMPDIGADEFPIAQHDAGILAVTFPQKTFSAGSQPVQVTLFNNGLDTLESATIEWTVNGVPQPPFDWSGALLSGNQLTGLAIGSFVFDIATTYAITAWTTDPNGQPDGDLSNDTASVGNLNAALAGVYTIGGSMPDFPDFTSAVQALNLGGVIGNVVFNIRNGTYTEQITLKEVVGMSAAQTVTFQSESGDSSAVTLIYEAIHNSLNFTLRLDSADYFRFRKMTIQAQNPAFCRAVHLLNGARYNVFENNMLVGANNYEVVLGEDFGNANHGNEFRRNYIYGGSNSIGLYGPSGGETGTVIADNNFVVPQVRGIYLSRQHGVIVSGNTITRTTPVGFDVGIYLYACANAFQVVKNKINVPHYAGIQLYFCENTIGNEGLVANNFVAVGHNGSSNVRGITLDYSHRNKVVFNTVHVRDNFSQSKAFQNSGSNNITVQNNVWANSGGGYAAVSASGVNVASDYNDLYSSGAPMAQWNGTDAADLDAWRTLSGQDVHSVSIDPGFASETDLHASEVDLDKAGTPVTGITDDIDGDSRNPQTPDIGADEFLPVRTNDVGIVELIAPNKTTPFASGSQPVSVVLKNNGVDTITGVTIRWRMNNAPQPAYAWAGFLTAGERDTVQIGAYNFPIGLGHTLLAHTENPNGQPDLNPENDSLWVADLYAGLSGTYTIGGVLPDFGSFAQAAASLNKGGVLGPVAFHVRNGIYTEQLALENIRGSSATNTVTFQSQSGDSMSVTLRFGSGSFVCQLNGTKHLTIKRMTLENTSTFFGSAVVHLQGSASHISLTNNRIVGTSFNYALIRGDAHLSSDNDLQIKNNSLEGASIGVMLHGISSANYETGLVIEGNTFSGQFNAINLIYQDGPVLAKNTVTASGDAVVLQNCHSAQLLQNKVSSSDGFGIVLNSCSGTPANRALVANNFVHVGGGGTRYGIATYYGDYQNYFHNSVNVAGNHANSAAFYQYYGTQKQVLNNVFANTGGGYAVYVQNGSGLAQSDFNDPFSTGPNLGYWDGTVAANLTALRTASGKESNSVSADPLFYSDTDLHMLQAQLDSAATPLASVTVDLDGNPRDPNFPDIGADEIDFLANDAGITALVAPANSCTLGSAETVTLRIQNYCSVPLSGFDVAYRIDGGSPVVENIGALTVSPGGTANYSFAATANFAFVGSYDLEAYTLLPDDGNPDNDTLAVVVTHLQTPVAVTNMIPTDGATGLSKTIAFSWSPSAGATLYDLYVWPDADPQPGTPTVANISQINYAFHNPGNILQFGQTYKWRLVAKNTACATNGPIQTFTLANLPDLIVQSATAPSGAFSGQQISISWEIKNTGSGGTGMGQWTDVAFLSTDQTLNQNLDTYLGGVANFSALASTEVYANSATFTLPQGISGTYYIFIVTDPYSYILEADDNNNSGVSAAVTVQLTPPPDLQVTAIVPPNNPFSGLPATVNWTVKNLGAGETRSAGWTDRAYLSPDANALNLANATLLGSPSFSGSLDVNDEYEKMLTANLPEGISGTYYIYVVTDVFSQEYEHANEGNNTTRSAAFTVFLTPPPDLQVTAMTAPASGSNRESKTISYTVSNEGGNTASGSWVDRLYGSTNPALANMANGTLLATVSRPNALEPTETYNNSFTVTLPDGTTGDYYFYVWTDAGNNVYEFTFESNNTRRATNATVLQTPDLAVQDLAAPAAAQSGDSITVTWTDQNTGTGKLLNRSWTDRLYLSQNSPFNLPTATLIGTLNATATLNPSTGLARSRKVAVPQGISGSYYLYVWADATEQIYENASEANNINNPGLPIAISLAPYPDLNPTSISAPSSAAAGTSVSVSYTVKNIGTSTAAPSWRDKIYLSPSLIWNPNAAQLLRTEVVGQALSPDSSYTRTVSVLVPVEAPGGVYYLFVFADQENNVYEFTGENNNLLAASGLTVTGYPPVNLAVTTFSGPSSAQSGASISVDWTVTNQAGVATIAPFWTDAVYLSADAVWQSATDQLLVSRQQNGPLSAGAAYSASRSISIPNGISGSYYLLLVNDPATLHNDSDRANNVASIAISITLTPPPDLVATSLSAPPQGFAGQPVEVSFTIKNSGTGSTAPVASWTDRFFLSTDFNLDAGDPTLTNVLHNGVLAVNGTYSETVQVFLPPYEIGNRILILKTDVNNAVFEFNGENNNTAAAAIVVVQPPPSDLVVTSIALPASAIAGEEVLLQWNLKNQGANPAIGYMREAVFFSQDTVWDPGDALLGTKVGSINLAPQATLAQSIMADLTGVQVGQYYAIVRTDILNNIAESDESNNTTVSSGPLTVTVNELLLNVPTAAALHDDRNLYYRIEIPQAFEGETLLVTLQGDSVAGANELYLRHGQVPTRAVYDFAYGTPFYGNQEVIVPELQAGTYYLLVYGNTTAGDQQAIALLARILNFEIHSVHAATGGNTGQVTLQINGAKFEPDMVLRLERDGASIEADAVHFVNSLRVYATFDLKGAVLGQYDVVAEKDGGGSAILPDGFTVVAGTAPNLATNIIQSPSARPGQLATITVEYANTGNTDIVHPVVQLTSIAGAPVSLDIATVDMGGAELELTLTELGGPPDVLRPGATGSITVYTKATVGLGFTLVFPQL